MPKTFDQSKDSIAKLCAHFKSNQESYRAPGIKEAHVRQSLIDPFFDALGWDVGNKEMRAPQYREVVPEDSLDVEGHQKAPDYTFRVGTAPKFYVEAKKCGVNINDDPLPAYQLRRYGFSARLPLSILTDFEEFGVYDCASRPRPGDKAGHARLQYLGFAEYPDKWREIWDVFSREAVWSGAFDQHSSSKRKRGASEVDDEFLKDIEGWRDVLARNIALRNADLSVEDLNAAVQLLIDRIIFLRMAEDRGLESYGQLHELCDRPDIYKRFMKTLCDKADAKYNSGLFHFEKEPGIAEAPDALTPRLEVDDNILKPVIQGLYFEHGSPYNFRVMPVEILGTVYERFLGKVIRLTAGHQAKVEEKPEVRKAGGVYYTPAYIVDYIVKNTVGKQIEGKSPAQLSGDKPGKPFRVLDMACGSGSFLLGAYQFLLDHCLRWYQENPSQKTNKAVYQNSKGDICLSIGERKRILTTHIFGVDIDRQAVETTKLSLLLKALEGENDASLSKQMELFHERALPNLADNIKCGNSLIGPDYFTGSLLPDTEEMKRVNAFDWKESFPDAMNAGGFDCIVGNPPYIRIQMMKEWAPLEIEIYKKLYKAAESGNYDIYVVFIEKGLKLLNTNGCLGFICPHKFFNSKYGMAIRGVVSEGKHLSHVVHFGDQQVFEGATTYTCLLFLNKLQTDEFRFEKVYKLDSWYLNGNGIEGIIDASKITNTEWNFNVERDSILLDKLSNLPTKLENVCERIFQGLKTGGDKVFIVEQQAEKKNLIKIYSHQNEAEYWIEKSLLHPLIKGGDSKAYCITQTNRLIIFPYIGNDGNKQTLIPQEILKKEYPFAWQYFLNNIDFLKAREHGTLDIKKWYEYTRNQALDVIHLAKIFTPDLSQKAAFALDTEGSLFFTGGVAGGYGILVSPQYSQHYVLSLLNSKLLDWFHHKNATQMRGGWYSYESRFIRTLPIYIIDFSKDKEKTIHDRLVLLSGTMVELCKKLAITKYNADKSIFQRQIDATNREINTLVYELYGLTEDEIRIVEGEK